MQEITFIAPTASSNAPAEPIVGSPAARVCWNNLEQFARQQLQEFLQRLLEEEITELLGRRKSERRQESSPIRAGLPPTEAAPPTVAAIGYRNGYGKPRQLTTSSGTVEIRRPRVRGLAERFESCILPLFQRRTPTVTQLLPELYLHGLSAGDFDLALRGLLGEGAPLSASTVARLKAVWQTEYESWKRRSLVGDEVVYLWVDGIYVKAGLEKEKAALLVVIGAMRDGSKQVLAVEAGHRESTEAWSAILRDLKQRGLSCPQLVIGDGALGIWGALANVFPAAEEQRCWNHRMVNVLDRVPQKHQAEARARLRRMMYAETRAAAAAEKKHFQEWTQQKGCGGAGQLLEEDWERLVRYYDFPQDHWKHLRTTNPVESPFAAVRLRTTAAKRYKKVDSATAVIWKTLLIAESRFRKLNAPELLSRVAEGARYEDGVRRKHSLEWVREAEKVAA